MKPVKSPKDRAAEDVKITFDDPRNKQIVANVLNGIRKRLYPKWSRDQLLCHPADSMAVCGMVRDELPFARTLTDFQILWAYLNASKRSKAPSFLSRKAHKC